MFFKMKMKKKVEKLISRIFAKKTSISQFHLIKATEIGDDDGNGVRDDEEDDKGGEREGDEEVGEEGDEEEEEEHGGDHLHLVSPALGDGHRVEDRRAVVKPLALLVEAGEQAVLPPPQLLQPLRLPLRL